MENDAIRLECLRLAATTEQDADSIEAAARKWADFVTGSGDGKIVEAARQFAKIIAPDRGPEPS